MSTAQVLGSAESSRGRASWATHAALLLVQIAFASQAVEAKLLMLPRLQGGEGLAPESLAMVRMIGGAIFFQAAVFSRSWAHRGLRTSPAPEAGRRSAAARHMKLVVLSALGVAVNQALFLTGLRLTAPFVASLVGVTIPVFAAAIAVLCRKEPATWRTAIGIALALSGVLWLTGVGSAPARSPDPAGGSAYGALILSLNCLSYAAYVVFSRDVVREMGSFRLMAWVFTYGAILFAPVGLRTLVSAVPTITPRGWLFLAYIVLVPTILAYGLNAWALSRSTASVVTIYIYTQPLIAGVLARLQLGDSISSRAWIAALLIVGGVAVTTRRRSERPTARST